MDLNKYELYINGEKYGTGMIYYILDLIIDYTEIHGMQEENYGGVYD